ncbi:uncharacterized protein M6B38_414465 [Iris pallida]|uniref:Late embryogenesis abundant protein LEA-2 subgroup domain-containing protein n=1 Tax=Iris pallida TaxID=29817 RepID=A0AAX6FKP7_IRIPA|nr:uncharacterized protein M6B38_414465 [Iris pallida]
MAERIYPSAKPNPHPPTSAPNGGAAPPSFPANKAQAYGRPMYRPQPGKQQQRRRRGGGRGCCCSLCLWLTLILIAALLLAAIAGGVFYVLYRPHRPTFTVSSLRLSQLNLTSPSAVASRLDLSITARNPNRKVEFAYDPVSVSVYSGDVHLGDGTFPPFLHEARNTTVLKTTVSSAAGESVDASAASGLKKKSTIPLAIELDTRAGVRVGKLKTKKIGIRVRCEGVSVPVPKNKKGAAAAAATTPDVSCKVKLRIKIWKWTI